MLIALWCEHVGVSWSQYAALLQILLVLENIGPILRLSKLTLDHLKMLFWGQFPLLPIRRKKIPVVSTKLPTLSAAERGLANSATCWLHFQDPITLLTNIARSPKFRSTMHHGMAHFVDEPAELWDLFHGHRPFARHRSRTSISTARRESRVLGTEVAGVLGPWVVLSGMIT
jgi:hypothetical protein